MKEQGIETFLKDLKAPAPDPTARLRAKRAALAEFARARVADNLTLPVSEDAGQETAESARLSRDLNSRGSASMKRFANRNWYAAAAGVGVLALGLTWVLPNLSRYSEELAEPELAHAPDADGRVLIAPEPSADPSPDGAANASATQPAADTAAGSPDQPVAAAAPAESRPRSVEPSAPMSAQEQEEPPRPHTNDVARQAQSLEQARVDAQAQLELRKREAFASVQPAVSAPPPTPPPAEIAGGEINEQVIVTGSRRANGGRLESKSAVVTADATSKGMVHRQEGRDRFQHFDANPVHRVADSPISTFSADVDTASYGFVRGRLNAGVLPQKDAVRVEEMVNYFDYSWPAASSRRAPFKPTVVVSDSPWSAGKKLVHIGIKGYEIDRDEAPDANLVLLLDVSGSMNEPDKLPLAVRSMELLLDSLKPGDTVGIVVYAGAAGTVLEPTPVSEKEKIVAALRSLRPGGSTAGAAGIERAYQLAEAHFRKGGVNRILLATDGDFNVGIDDTRELTGFVERKREKGVYLSVLGFGNGNYRDELAQALAQNGNGVAAYIDTENEARKVLVQEASASLFTIAKDVKLQVEFNPATVSEYRLVGYESRALKREDFNNDAVDAGDVGAGHTVTAIYEITPVGAPGQSVDEPRYEENRRGKRSPVERGSRAEYGFLKIRYKLPGERQSQLMSEPIPVRTGGLSPDVKRDVDFSTAVAGFAQLLRGDAHTGSLGYGDVIEQAQSARGEDRFGYRAEFIELVRKAREAAKE